MIKKKDLQDAHDAYERGDYKTAYKLFLPLAEQGHNDAQYILGLIHVKGEGVPQDYEKAEKWWRLSAEQGNVNAQFNLDLLLKKTSKSFVRPDDFQKGQDAYIRDCLLYTSDAADE